MAAEDSWSSNERGGKRVSGRVAIDDCTTDQRSVVIESLRGVVENGCGDKECGGE